ncbi:acyltransferase family protein, partial [Maricaulis sp.]
AELDRHAVARTKSDILSYLGDISYAIYMIHVPFFMVAFNVLQDVFGLIDETMSTGVFIVLFALMIIASSATYQWLERPARSGIRKLGNRVFGAPTHKPSSR